MTRAMTVHIIYCTTVHTHIMILCFESDSALVGGCVVLSLMNHTNTVQCGARVSRSYSGRRGSG
jgi:hypothetical protein